MTVIRTLISLFLILMSPLLVAKIDPALEQKIIAGLKKWHPSVNFHHIIETPIPGLYHAQVVGGPTVYVSKDGQYFIRGELTKVGIGKTENWQDTIYAPMRRELITAAKVEDMVVFKPQGESKAVIYVFTDVDCGYCLRLHREIPALNDMGVEVRYLAFPRAGLNSESAQKLLSIWCADDPVDAMNRMKQRQSIPTKSCQTAAIKDHVKLVQDMSLNATPAIILSDGLLISGYRRASQIQQILGL